MTSVLKLAALSGAAVLALAGAANATIINLQSAGVTGTGSFFVGAGNEEDLSIVAGGYLVKLQGGTPLGPNIASLPATDSIAYGTADFANTGSQSGYTNPITISFFDATTLAPKDVTNFFVTLLNGNTTNVDYTIADNLGTTSTFNIGSNFSSGQRIFGIAAAGNVITVTGGTPPQGACCAWDYFVNDIGFNQATPGVPEPASWALMITGFGAAGALLRQRRRAMAAAA